MFSDFSDFCFGMLQFVRFVEIGWFEVLKSFNSYLYILYWDNVKESLYELDC